MSSPRGSGRSPTSSLVAARAALLRGRLPAVLRRRRLHVGDVGCCCAAVVRAKLARMGRTLAVVLMLVAASPVGAQQALPPGATGGGAPVLPADVGAEVDRATVEALRRELPPIVPAPKGEREAITEVHALAATRLRTCLDDLSPRVCWQTCAARWPTGTARGPRGATQAGYSACAAACLSDYLRGSEACVAEADAWRRRELAGALSAAQLRGRSWVRTAAASWV